VAWRLPPLNPLRAFEAAARAGGMTPAAAELGVTQVAVTRQVARLERALRVRLFDRAGRRLRLTPAGEALFMAATRCFRDLQEAAEHVSVAAEGRQVLRVVGYANFTLRWLIPRLGDFQARHPGIDLELTSSLEPVDFARSGFDAAIRSGAGAWPNRDCLPLAPIVLAPVCSPALARRLGLAAPADLRRATLLHTAARPQDWARWLDGAGAPGVDPRGGIWFDNGGLAYQAAIEGVGVAMAQRVLVEEDLRRGRLVTPFSRSVETGEGYYFVAPPDRRPPKLLAFRAWLAEVAGAA
jgi:LysR family glycine cleavage system transcriptional activator